MLEISEYKKGLSQCVEAAFFVENTEGVYLYVKIKNVFYFNSNFDNSLKNLIFVQK